MNNSNKNYTPLYFLASLWSGWLAVTFFMYLMFMTRHVYPIPTFDTLLPYLIQWNILYIFLILISIAWILIFSWFHLYLLFRNIKEYKKFKKTENFTKLKNSNAEISLMAIPLTLAMSMNVWFIVFAILVPKLWTVIEYVFPFAIIWFLAIWWYALYIFSEYFTRIITKWDFDFLQNNSLGQMISIFSFAMISVWLAAPAAMSHVKLTSLIALFFSIFFLTIAVFFGFIKLILWFKSMLEHWINKEASPTFWILIPILTLIWITFVRHSHAVQHWLELWFSSSVYFLLTSVIISLQIIFAFLWYKIMKMNNYFDDYLNWDKNSPWSYALICPWVAAFVYWFFFIHLWLVWTWLISKFWVIYFILILWLLFIKYKTIQTMIKLNKKLLY